MMVRVACACLHVAVILVFFDKKAEVYFQFDNFPLTFCAALSADPVTIVPTTISIPPRHQPQCVDLH